MSSPLTAAQSVMPALVRFSARTARSAMRASTRAARWFRGPVHRWSRSGSGPDHVGSRPNTARHRRVRRAGRSLCRSVVLVVCAGGPDERTFRIVRLRAAGAVTARSRGRSPWRTLVWPSSSRESNAPGHVVRSSRSPYSCRSGPSQPRAQLPDTGARTPGVGSGEAGVGFHRPPTGAVLPRDLRPQPLARQPVDLPRGKCHDGHFFRQARSAGHGSSWTVAGRSSYCYLRQQELRGRVRRPDRRASHFE